MTKEPENRDDLANLMEGDADKANAAHPLNVALSEALGRLKIEADAMAETAPLTAEQRADIIARAKSAGASEDDVEDLEQYLDALDPPGVP